MPSFPTVHAASRLRFAGVALFAFVVFAPKVSAGTADAFGLANLRLDPKNATGGTDLYSRNFGWGTSLVSLPGRAGLNLNLGITYNSLVWLKDTTNGEIIFDPDVDDPSPGFNFGMPRIEPPYQDPNTGEWRFLMVEPSGTRTEFRQIDNGLTFGTGDSSYRLLEINDSEYLDGNPTRIEITVTTTDGTRFHYVSNSGAYRCYEVKDRNGNYISITYDTSGRMTTITDTLGRVVTINYTSGYPTSITQTWKGTNGSGSNTTHTWATFDYTNVTVTTSFSGLTVIGPANSSTVKALEKITYADGSFTKFEYNSYVQVKKISQVAADSTSHVLNYVSTNLDSISGSQTDCPRLSEQRSWVENFNLDGYGVAQPVVVTNSLTTSATYSLPNSITGSATRIEVAMTGHPDGLYTRTYVGASGYKEGLTLATEDCTGSNCATRLRWTWNDWTQDNTSASYITNPRVIETRVGDGTNTKRTTIGYGSNSYGLPEEVKVYDTDLATVLKTQTTSYELGSAYTSRRILGLPSEVKLYDGTTSGTLMSKVTYAYDEGNLTGTDPVQNISPTQHDNTNYSSSFITGRGLLTSVTRWDATAPTTSGSAVTSSMKYNTAGAVVSKTDPLSHTVKIAYADNFNSSPGVSTYAYPTTLTDPAGNSSTVKYRYDIGANVEATSPAPAGQTYGKTSKREYDDTTAMLKKDSVYVNTTLKFYTRYAVPTTDNGIQRMSYTTVIDTSGSTSGPDTADEVLTETWLDGAGRVRRTRTEHPGSTGGWSATQTEYDILGRVYRTSVPTEVSVSGTTWTAAGDDSTRGWVWNYTYYDWKGRTVRTVPSDSTGSDGKDTLIAYAGCGCAGGQITTISGPVTTAVDVSGTTQTTKRRTQKVYEDILGRTYKIEIWDLDGGGTAPYSTTKTTFNGRDQATLIRQYAGADTSSTYQDTTMSYDGHGRLYQSHKPEQRDSSNNLKYTTYTYNADDSISSITDGRGAVTNYTYNSRSLLTNIGWTVPGGSGITDPTDVTYSYDNLGNRTQMTDGLGQVDYSYDSLSRMTDETRDFTDTLADAPISGSKFQLQYSYTLSGQMQSYTDPYGQEIDYTRDKKGRVSTVTGSTFGGVTSYVSDADYRAWGSVKRLEYSNGFAADTTYNDRLQPASFTLQKSGSSATMQKAYTYYNDGVLKLVDDQLNGIFDRMTTFDHVGRPVQGKSSSEANGTTVTTDLQHNLPYRQSYAFNAFDNLTQRDNLQWGRSSYTSSFNLSYSYTNNRVTNTNWQYDDDGRPVWSAAPEPPMHATYNAAGQQTETQKSNQFLSPSYQVLRSFDGDSLEEKRVESDCGTNAYPTCTQSSVKTEYFIRSSVMGGIAITETSGTGAKVKTQVVADGSRVGWQARYNNYYDAVYFDHSDSTGLSCRVSEATLGLVMSGDDSDLQAAEFDPMGGNVGVRDVYANSRPQRGDTSSSSNLYFGAEPQYMNGHRIPRDAGGVGISHGMDPTARQFDWLQIWANSNLYQIGWNVTYMERGKKQTSYYSFDALSEDKRITEILEGSRIDPVFGGDPGRFVTFWTNQSTPRIQTDDERKGRRTVSAHVQKAYDDCVASAWRTFRRTYLKDGGKAIAAGALIGGSIRFGTWMLSTPHAMSSVLGAAEGAKVTSLVSLSPVTLSSLLIRDITSRNEPLIRDNRIKDCDRRYPNANHYWWSGAL